MEEAASFWGGAPGWNGVEEPEDSAPSIAIEMEPRLVHYQLWFEINPSQLQ